MTIHSKTLRRIPSGIKRELKKATARQHRRTERIVLRKALKASVPEEAVNLVAYKRSVDPWHYD